MTRRNRATSEAVARRDAVYLHEGFEEGLGDFDSVRVPSEHRDEALRVVDEPSRAGGRALQLHAKHPTEHGWDYDDVNNVRVEVGTHGNRWEYRDDGIGVVGEPFWFAFSVYVPDDWVPDTQSVNLAEFHRDQGANEDGFDEKWGIEGGGSGKPWVLHTSTGGSGDEYDHLEFRNDYLDEGGEFVIDTAEVPIEPGTWHDVVTHVEWSNQFTDSEGRMRIWVDDEQVYDHTGNTFVDRAGDDGRRGPRPLKLSVYKYPWKYDWTPQRKTAVTWTFDEVRFATGDATYEDVAPGDGSGGDDGDSGGGDDDGAPSLPHAVAITKDDPDVARGPVEYELTVSDALGETDDLELGGNDAKNGRTATGGMGPAGGTDTWAFDGVVTSFSLSGDANVSVDGNGVPPGDVVGLPTLDVHRGGYDLPTFGAGDWHEPLNAVIGAVETDVRGAATLVAAHDGGDDRSYGGYTQPARGTENWHRTLNETLEAMSADITALADRVSALDGGDGRSYGGYTQPARGTENWHEPLNAAFEATAADLTALRDRVAALDGGGDDGGGDDREEVPPADSDDFESALRDLVGADRGRDWTTFVENRERRTVHDVRDYGAELDGSTNDRGALLDALDAAASEDPSGIVYVPAGELRYGPTGWAVDKRYNGVALVGDGYDTVLRPDTRDDGEPGGGYRAHGVWFTDRPTDGGYRDVTLANFRMVGSDVDAKMIGGRPSITEGSGNRVSNVWLENAPGTALGNPPTGTRLTDVTVTGADAHGIALRNGGSSDPDEDRLKSIDPEPVVAKRLYVADCSERGSGRYAIDVSSGANIVVDTFVAEDNRNLGMKVPKVENVRVLNGLFKNNAGTDFQTLATRWKFEDAYLDNVRVDAAGSDDDAGRAVSFRQGDWTVGLLVVEGGDRLNRQVRVADSIGELEFQARRIVSRDSGGDGVTVREAAGLDVDVETLVARGHDDCDLAVESGDVTVETLDVGGTCGDDPGRGAVSIPDVPDIEETR